MTPETHSAAPAAQYPALVQNAPTENPTAINPARLACLERKAPTHFQPLTEITRPNLKTAEAAFYLNRAPQTLRAWACLENGPLRPKRIAGILAWNTAEVKALVGI